MNPTTALANVELLANVALKPLTHVVSAHDITWRE